MNQHLKYIFFSLLVILLTNCTDHVSLDNPLIPSDKVEIKGDKVILTTSIDASEFKQAVTRAFTEEPDLNTLHLYLIEFVDYGSPLTNTLLNVYRPEEETVDLPNKKVIYKVSLTKTDQPRILHLLALADDDLVIPYGVEASVMPGLTSGMVTDANGTVSGVDTYWRRIAFDKGYCVKTIGDENEEVWEPNQDLKDKLIGKNVKLVRNFAKISVGVDASIGNNFELQGFLVVNTPQKGTMAPYSSSERLFPEFLDSDGSPLPYSTVALKYKGISPSNTLLGNQVTEEDAPEIPNQALTPVTTQESNGNKTWNVLPAHYMYERPFSTTSRTYVIVKGIFRSETYPNTQNKPCYYKLDLGNNDNNGIFRYYGLLRNFNYFIRITGVKSEGYETASAASVGTVYNNISFDIDTDHLMNMSDGQGIIRVNFTTAVITDKDSVLEFRYAYKHDIWTNGGTFNNDLAKFINLVPGDVIASVNPANPNQSNDAVENGVTWRSVKITCKEPTNITETQEFTIVNPLSGLGRTVTLVSHNKWDFENPREFAKIWENYPSTYEGLKTEDKPTNTNNSTFEGWCGTAVGSQFTIFFDIPDNIPEALFPLVFTIESSNQGLENEPMGTIVVSPGPSLFPDNNGDNRIQYNKSVTWTEYNAPLRMDVRDDNGTALGNPEDGPVTHRVRCRFRTIENVPNNTEVTIKIANINFNTGEVKLTRTIAANDLLGPGLVITN